MRKNTSFATSITLPSFGHFSKSGHTKTTLKIVVLGDSSVGKTAIIERYMHNEFSPYHTATIGAEFESKSFVVDRQKVNVHIWDTAGQERFQSLDNVLFRGADACVLVYDETSAKTLRSLDSWRTQFLARSGVDRMKEFPFFVFGNKVDLANERAVGAEMGKSWCRRRNNLEHFEVSAKTGQNIESAFERVIRGAYYNLRSYAPKDGLPEYRLLQDAEKSKMLQCLSC